MGWEHPPETVWKAQEMYCVDRLSFDRVSALVGVSATTLKAWADKYGWREKREEIAQAESEIRTKTILGRKAVLERLIEATDGKEASQVAFAVASLEGLALKQQELAASGKIPSVHTDTAPVIATRAEAVAALRQAVENKLGLALADPKAITSAAVRDVVQCLDLIAELEAGLPKPEEPEEAAKRGMSQDLKERIMAAMSMRS